MSNHDKLNMREFTRVLTEKTNTLEIKWDNVPRRSYHKLLDRVIVDSIIKEPYFSDGKTGRVVIGKYQKKVYYEEEDYYLEDDFFITITNSEYESPTTFLKSDDDNSLGHSFVLSLSKLHRLIQINMNDIKNRLENWF